MLKDDKSAELASIARLYAADIDAVSVRVFHGCRPVDATLYLREGLRVPTYGMLLSRLNEIMERDVVLMNNPECQENARRILNQVFQTRVAQSPYFKPEIHVTCDEMALMRYGAHYMKYGPEAVLAALTDIIGKRARPAMERVGTACILQIDAPLRLFPENERDIIALELLRGASAATKGDNWVASSGPSLVFTQNIEGRLLVIRNERELGGCGVLPEHCS